MLKYSTGRSKPGWGKMECRPVWWPDDVPWANVRSDVRTTEQKKKVDYYLQDLDKPYYILSTYIQ
jgi:nuclear respiratory factor 1